MGKNHSKKNKNKQIGKKTEKPDKSNSNQNNNPLNKNNHNKSKQNNDDHQETKIFELIYDNTSEYKRNALDCRNKINFILQSKYPQYEMITQTSPYNENYYTLYHCCAENWGEIYTKLKIYGSA